MRDARHSSFRILGLAAVLLMPAPASASAGVPTSSAQNGNWAVQSTWSGGLPTSTVDVLLNHDIVVTDAGMLAKGVLLGFIQPGTLTLAGGDLSLSGTLTVGAGVPCEAIIKDGSLSVDIELQVQLAGLLTIRGGQISPNRLTVGDFSQESELLIEGGKATVIVTNMLLLGSGSRLVLRPRAPGPGGLTTIQTGDCTVEDGAIFELDTSLYKPRVGDTWTIVSCTGSLNAQPASLVASQGYAFVEDFTTAGKVKITVTRVPFELLPRDGPTTVGPNPGFGNQGPAVDEPQHALLKDLGAADDGVRLLATQGPPILGTPFALQVTGGTPGALGLLAMTPNGALPLPGVGATRFLGPGLFVSFYLDGTGRSPELLNMPSVGPAFASSDEWYARAMISDFGIPLTSNGLIVRAGTTSPDRLVAEPVVLAKTPGGLVGADVDGDGDIDVFALTADGSTLQLMLSLPDGTYATSDLVLVSDGPSVDDQFNSTAVGDFDENGFLDAVAVSQSNTDVAVLLGNGDGTFSVSWISTNPADEPETVTVGDFDEDAHLDILVLSPDGFVLIPGNGDGTFGAPLTTVVSLGSSVQTTELDGDDRPDLVFFQAGQIKARFGTGAGTFQNLTLLAIPTQFVTELLTGDVDADGDVDLLFDVGNDFAIALNQGEGTFGPIEEHALGPGNVRQLLLGDMTGDGRDDVVAIVRQTGKIFMQTVPSLPDGTLGPTGKRLRLGFDDMQQGFLADMNGDRFLDVVVPVELTPGAPVGVQTTLQFFHGLGNGRVQGARSENLGLNAKDVALADVTGDGLLDVVTHTETSIEVLVGDGAGGYGDAITTSSLVNAFALQAADLDGDGDDDLVVSGADGVGSGLFVLLSQGDGTFAAPIGPVFIGSTQFRLERLNADDIIDLVAPGGGGLTVLFGNGDGTFVSSTAPYAGVSPSRPDFAPLGGFGGFGDLDMAYVDAGDDVVVRLNKAGSFGPAIVLDTGFGTVEELLLADVTGDGLPDAILRLDDSTSQVAVLPDTGAGFGSPILTATSAPLSALEYTDLDGDGRIDLVATYDNGDLVFLRGQGDGSFVEAETQVLGGGLADVAVGDADGDSLPDVAVLWRSPAQVLLLVNTAAE